MIKIMRKSEVVSGVPDRWKDSYADTRGKPKWEPHDAITDRLQELKKRTFTASEVEEIIGNKSWTTIQCEECDEEKDILCSLGDDNEWGGPKGYYCIDCLRQALSLIEAKQ